MRTLSLGCVIIQCFFAIMVGAQPQPKLADRIEALEQKVEEALKGAADGGAALKSLEDMQNTLLDLKKQIEELRTMNKGYEDLRNLSDTLKKRLDNLELTLAAFKMDYAARSGTSGYYNGFFIKTSNRHFLLRLNGLLQAGYVGQLFDEKRSETGVALGRNVSSFSIRRAQLGFSGHLLNWRLGYGVELNFGELDPGPLLEGWGELRIHRVLSLRFGKQTVPFSRQFLIHNASQQFIDRSGAATAFAPGWDTGVMVAGEIPLLGVLSYQAGVFNGAGSKAAVDDNTDFLYVARLVYQPLGALPLTEGDADMSKLKVALGGAFFYNLAATDIDLRKGITDPTQIALERDKDGDGNVDNVGIFSVGAELTVRYRGLAWQSELFYRKENPAAADAARGYLGWYTQASAFHPPSTLEIAARYSYWEPNDYGLPRDPSFATKIHEAAIVVSALTFKRRVKWQAEYSHQWLKNLHTIQKDLEMDNNLHQVRLQAQLSF